MGTSRLIAIGDVHGCVHALDAVLESIDPTSDDRIVFLGDMIDQGKESREVLERIIALKRRVRRGADPRQPRGDDVRGTRG